MTVTFGFFNSINHDRLYDTLQLSSIFDGIIMDGIYQSIGTALTVVESSSSGLTINVGVGRAWFNHTWTNNDDILPLSTDSPDVLYSRIDSVILEVNSENAVRANSIYIIQGTPGPTPVAPTLINTATIHQYSLADLTIPSGCTHIGPTQITNHVVTAPCQFVIGVLKTIDATDLVSQWRSEIEGLLDSQRTEFNTWFADLQDVLSGDVEGNLQNEITTLSTETLSSIGDLQDAVKDLQGISGLSLTVSPSGDDTNHGTFVGGVFSGAPFLTIQQAVAWVCGFDTNMHTISIHVAPGTYNETVVLQPIKGGGIIQIVGSSMPIVNGFITYGVGPGEYVISGLKLANSVSGSVGIQVANNYVVNIGTVNFGAFPGGTHMKVMTGGRIIVGNDVGYTISGLCACHCYLSENAIFEAAGAPIVFATNPLAIGIFLNARCLSFADLTGVIFTHKEYMTGQRYQIVYNSVVLTGGLGWRWLPGNSGGELDTGGQLG